MKLSKSWIIFSLILLLSAFLRLYRLDSVPPSLNWDEAAIGWNAYSLWNTHLDEYGTKWPWVFKSFGDYKAPGLFYITAPFVGLLGPAPFIVRLPSALAGIATVGVLFFLAMEIGERLKLSAPQKRLFGLISMLLLAVSPWHLLYSRAAYEANVALFFITAGVWLAFVSLKRPYLWFFSGVFFILSLYTYHSPKLFLPFFLLGFFLIFLKEMVTGIWKYKWVSLIAILLLLISFKPLIDTNLKGKGAQRFYTSIFYDASGHSLPFSLGLVRQLGDNLVANVTPGFYLKSSSENPRLSLHNYGLMPIIEWIFFMAGVILIIVKWKQRGSKLLLVWFICGLIPAAIGREVPHSLRALNSLIAVCLITGFALIHLLNYLESQNEKVKYPLSLKKYLSLPVIISLILSLFFFIDIFQYFNEYYGKYPVYAAQDWQYGYKQAAEYALSQENTVDKIIFSNTYGQAYIFTYLFQKRQPMNVLWGEMSKYTFRDFKWEGDKFEKNALLIGSGDEIPTYIPTDRGIIIKEIPFPDGSIAFRIVKTL